MRTILIPVVLTLSLVAAQAQRHAGDEPATCDKVILTRCDQSEGSNHGHDI
jgi:hypothetical protein